MGDLKFLTPSQPHNMEVDHELISMVILPRPVIHEG